MTKDKDLLQNPKEQLFYRFLGTAMMFVGAGDRTLWGYEPPNWLLRLNRFVAITFAPICSVSYITYLAIHHRHVTFNTLSIMLSIIPVTLVVNSNFINARLETNKKVMKDFMTRIHLYNYQEESEFNKNKLLFVERFSRFTFYYLFVFLMLDWAAWILVTSWNNYVHRDLINNKTLALETVVYVIVPFDFEHDWTIWIIYQAVNAYVVWVGCITMVLFNTLNYMFVYHLIGHIQILKYKLETNFLDKCSDDETRLRLAHVIEYHSFVIRIFRDIEAAFGMNVTVNYIYNLIADSLLLYLVMVGDKGNLILYGLMIMVYVGELVLTSFVLEEIRRQSDGLSDLVYNLPWEKMSITNQKMVILILNRVQPPLVFTAMFGLRAGVNPMIAIIKSTFSYYVMLKSSM